MEETIGKYKVLREIGKGGMGIVYKGLDPETQKTVAIKVLPLNLVDRSTVERFNREARAMARLHHTNLVEVFEVDMTKGQHYFIMEFIDGESLKALISRNGIVPESKTLDIIAQVAKGIGCIHEEGMIHRDIKPGNVMVTADGKVKVMDFGLVKIAGVTNVTISGSALGTAEYMSPEQVSDEAVDTRSDIYSLGVTMYEMLAGRPPFQGDSYQAVLMKHKYEVPSPLRQVNPQVSVEAEAIVNKAMAKQLSERYQKAEDLVADISKLRGTDAQTEKMSLPPEVCEAKQASGIKLPFGKIVTFILIAGIGYLGYVNREVVTEKFSDLLSQVNFDTGKGSDLVGQTEKQLKKFEKSDKYYLQGQEYYHKGLYNKAIAEYKKAINLRRDYALYYKDLAISYEAKGDIRSAVGTWQKLLKYAPSSSFAQMAGRKIAELK